MPLTAFQVHTWDNTKAICISLLNSSLGHLVLACGCQTELTHPHALFISERKRNKWKTKTDNLRSRHYRNQRFAPPQQLPPGAGTADWEAGAQRGSHSRRRSQGNVGPVIDQYVADDGFHSSPAPRPRGGQGAVLLQAA